MSEFQADYQRWQSYTTFQELGGREVRLDEIREELSRLPLDGVLGFLAHLCLQATEMGRQFFSHGHQGGYLNLAIVDDFPGTLPNASSMYIPGRIPVTGDRHRFIHLHNIAWLAHEALLYSPKATTKEIDHSLKTRCCRLLLIVNDFLDEKLDINGAALSERREVALHFLRLWQFTKLDDDVNAALRRLARQWLIFRTYLCHHLPQDYDIEGRFQGVTRGVSVDEYFVTLAAIVLLVFDVLIREKKNWFDLNTLTANIKGDVGFIGKLLERWSITPGEYREKVRAGIGREFYFQDLRETPLVAARGNETFVVPVLSFLFDKIVDEPYFILSNEKSRATFQSAHGKAFETYAESIVDLIVSNISDGSWRIVHNPMGKEGEICDTYIQNGEIGIAFEFKGMRLNTKFLKGEGDNHRVLGPDKKVLEEIEDGRLVQVTRSTDNGILTRGLWQLDRAGNLLIQWAEANWGIRPRKIIPVIVHHAYLHVDELARKSYLDPLVETVDLFSDSFWHRPQWLSIDDLEYLARLAEQQELDLGNLFLKKENENASGAFDEFLMDLPLPDKPFCSTISNAAIELFEKASAILWPDRNVNR